MSTNLSEIAFEQITGNYYWGKYGDFKVIVDISTGYINAAHLCGMATNKSGNKKELSGWKRYDLANELIDEVAASLRIHRDELLSIPTDLPNEIRGTYAHPKLIPHIASWASPKFAVKVSDIVNAHLVREYKESIRVKDQTIDRLEKKIDQITLQNAEQSHQIAGQTARINELLGEIKKSREETSYVAGQLDVITNELETTSAENEKKNV